MTDPLEADLALTSSRGPAALERRGTPTSSFAAAVGVCVLGLYASQPLLGALAQAFGLGGAASAVTMLTLLGYAAGLLLLVPIIDVAPNRPVLGWTLAGLTAALLATALAHSAAVLLVASFAVGAGSSVIQMLVPSAAALAPERERGRVVGDVMGGLMLGILVSRPLAAFTGAALGWRSFYAALAALVASVPLWLWPRLPRRVPPRASYPAALASLASILRAEPVLRRRALYQALLMGAFGAFWTSVALLLAGPTFALGPVGIGLFALAGAGGVLSAPIAGRAADAGRARAATTLAHAGALAASIVAAIAAAAAPLVGRGVALAALTLAAAALDAAVIADQAIGRRAVNLLAPEARGRINGLYTGLFFVGGAAGAGLSGLAWSRGGWSAVCGLAAAFAAVALVLSSRRRASGQWRPPARPHPTIYRTVMVKGVRVFYREAGDPRAPTLLLLHGFPSSSRMYQALLERLSDRYHLVAPDYPGFGHSDAPPPAEFAYTFDHLAEIVEAFTEALGLSRYVLFVQDYGGPVGLRLALAHPERVRGIVIQNAVSHEEGLGAPWVVRRAFWADRAAHEDALRASLLSPEATRARHVGTSPRPERYDPDAWVDELAFLSRPGQLEIQTELFFDYRTNVAAYPRWQAWLRAHRPPLLVLWGRHDASFTVAGGTAYRAEVPDAEIHLLDAGHFALDEAADEVAALTRRFLEGIA